VFSFLFYPFCSRTFLGGGRLIIKQKELINCLSHIQKLAIMAPMREPHEFDYNAFGKLWGISPVSLKASVVLLDAVRTLNLNNPENKIVIDFNYLHSVRVKKHNHIWRFIIQNDKKNTFEIVHEYGKFL
jgi:hypothetical protein